MDNWLWLCVEHKQNYDTNKIKNFPIFPIFKNFYCVLFTNGFSNANQLSLEPHWHHSFEDIIKIPFLAEFWNSRDVIHCINFQKNPLFIL